MRGSGTESAVAVGSRDRTDLREDAARIWATGALVGQQPAYLRQTPAPDASSSGTKSAWNPAMLRPDDHPLARSPLPLPNDPGVARWSRQALAADDLRAASRTVRSPSHCASHCATSASGLVPLHLRCDDRVPSGVPDPAGLPRNSRSRSHAILLYVTKSAAKRQLIIRRSQVRILPGA